MDEVPGRRKSRERKKETQKKRRWKRRTEKKRKRTRKVILSKNEDQSPPLCGRLVGTFLRCPNSILTSDEITPQHPRGQRSNSRSPWIRGREHATPLCGAPRLHSRLGKMWKMRREEEREGELGWERCRMKDEKEREQDSEGGKDRETTRSG